MVDLAAVPVADKTAILVGDYCCSATFLRRLFRLCESLCGVLLVSRSAVGGRLQLGDVRFQSKHPFLHVDGSFRLLLRHRAK